MIRKCPDCGEKRVAFSTRKTIGRFLHPILPFRAGRCVNCKRRRTDVNGWLLVVCLVAFFLIVTYVSIVVSGLSPKRQQMGGGGGGDLKASTHHPSKVNVVAARDERPLTVEVTRKAKKAAVSRRAKSRVQEVRIEGGATLKPSLSQQKKMVAEYSTLTPIDGERCSNKPTRPIPIATS